MAPPLFLSIFRKKSSSNFYRRAFSASRQSCWKCGAIVIPSQLACPNCSKITNLTSPSSYISLFKQCYPSGTTVNLYGDLDLKCLKKSYLKLQSEYHPDNLSSQGKPPEISAFISKAYQTLKDPVKRMIYILENEFNMTEVLGESAAEDVKSQDPALLEQMMELHEVLDELASLQPDIARQRLTSLKDDLVTEQNEKIEAMETAFSSKDLKGVVKMLRDYQYLATLRSRVEEHL